MCECMWPCQRGNLLAMYSKVFDFVQRNGLVLWDGIIWRLVSFWICSKGTNLDFSSRNSSCWINNNCKKGLLILLVKHLCGNINAREPASITRMRMVPPNHIFQPTSLYQKLSKRMVWTNYIHNLPTEKSIETQCRKSYIQMHTA